MGGGKWVSTWIYLLDATGRETETGMASTSSVTNAAVECHEDSVLFF